MSTVPASLRAFRPVRVASRRLGRRRAKKRLDAATSELAKGLAAGVAGTAAMTLSGALETRLRGDKSGPTPDEVAHELLEVEPKPKGSRLGPIAHWTYGTGWGAARGALALVGLSGARAAVAHGALVWVSGNLTALPLLGVVPPPWRWGPSEVAMDGLHHVIYAGGVTVAWEALERA